MVCIFVEGKRGIGFACIQRERANAESKDIYLVLLAASNERGRIESKTNTSRVMDSLGLGLGLGIGLLSLGLELLWVRNRLRVG